MDKKSYFVIGALLGAAIGAAVDYLFAPAQGALFDRRYQSRLDRALADGERAAAAREAELRSQLRQLQGLSDLPHRR